jgi:hypothetical protein
MLQVFPSSFPKLDRMIHKIEKQLNRNDPPIAVQFGRQRGRIRGKKDRTPFSLTSLDKKETL